MYMDSLDELGELPFQKLVLWILLNFKCIYEIFIVVLL